MRAKALLFDKDGTLFDFQKTWAPWVGRLIDDLSAGDGAVSGAMDAAMGYNRRTGLILPDSIVISGTVAQGAETIAQFLPGKTVDELIVLFDETGALAAGIEVLPLAAYLDQLDNLGLGYGVATNDSESTARAQLRAFDLEHRFDFIAGFDSGFGGKPGPGMCLAFAQHANVAPEQIVMVGDSKHDLDAGRAAGMQTVGVLTGVATAPDLAPHADAVLPDIGHIPSWLASQS